MSEDLIEEIAPVPETPTAEVAFGVATSQAPSDLAQRYWIYAGIYLLWVSWIVFATYTSNSFAVWVNGWHRWDAEWYFRIWNFGYGEDPRTLVFPPGYSWIVGFTAGGLKIPFDLAALVVNLPATFAAGILSSEFLSKKFGISWWLLFISYLCYPVTLYTFVPYSDCLFSALFWAALTFADRPAGSLTWRENLTACALMFLAPFVRLTGFALAIWLLFRRWFALTVFVTLALIMLGNWIITGDVFYFLHVQSQFLMPRGWLADGIRYHARDLVRVPLGPRAQNPLFWLQVTVLPWISLVMISISTVWLFRKQAWVLALTLITVALFSRNQAYWRSVFRYDLPLVPMVVVPWLVWSRAGVGGSPRLKIYAARVFLFLLLFIGFLLQWGFVRRLHNGLWLF